jgi:APA family basic amino acid/polyamine antiporter
LARPFRCWGYPVTPGLFAVIGMFSLGYTAVVRPVEAAWGVGTLVLGVGVWLIGFGRRG